MDQIQNLPMQQKPHEHINFTDLHRKSLKYLLVSPSLNAGNHGFLAVVFSQLFLRLTQCEQSATAVGQCPLSTVCAAVKEAVDQSNRSNNSDSAYLVNHLVKGTVLLALGQRWDQLGCLLS
jgi:hypothetical protein